METPSSAHCLGSLPSLRQALAVLNGKWKLPIMVALRTGSCRFCEIERNVPGISGKVLAKELKDLEDHQLLLRTVHAGPPVAVTYALLPYAETLDPIIHGLSEWGRQHQQRLETATFPCVQPRPTAQFEPDLSRARHAALGPEF